MSFLNELHTRTRMNSILISYTYSCKSWCWHANIWISSQGWVQRRMCKAHCTYLICSAVFLLCTIIIGKQMEHYNREGLWLTWYAAQKVGIFFLVGNWKREIFTFLVEQLLPLCTSFDCTAVSMQQRFDNLGFYTKIYKKFLLQVLEAISYFFSSSLVLFASSDSWKKTCVNIWVFSATTNCNSNFKRK